MEEKQFLASERVAIDSPKPTHDWFNDMIVHDQAIATTSALFMLDYSRDEDMFGCMQQEQQQQQHRLTGTGLNQQSFGGNSITCFDSVLANSDCGRDMCNAVICKPNSHALANTTTTNIRRCELVVPHPFTYSRRSKQACVPVAGTDTHPRAECCSARIKDGAVDEQTMSSGGGRELVAVNNNVKLANGEGDEKYDIEPMDCPQAVIDYFDIEYRGDQNRLEELKKSGGTIRSLTFKAKQHLAFAGWELSKKRKQQTRKELRYRSPLPPNKSEITLVAACKRYLEDNKLITTDGSVPSLKKPKGAPNGSREYENNDICKEVQGLMENKNSGNRCKEGFASIEKKSPDFLSGCRENKSKSMHSYSTVAQGFSWGTRKVLGFVSTAKSSEGFVSSQKNSEDFLNGCREKSTHSCHTDARGFSWGTRKQQGFASTNSLPVDWQAIKGYYTEPRDTLDLKEVEDEYDRDLKEMVNENRTDREKSKPKPCIDRLGGGYKFNGGLNLW